VLGVCTDMSAMETDHCVDMYVTQARKDKIRDAIDATFERGVVTHAEASKLFGKARFVLSPLFGRVFLAALQPLHAVSHLTLLSRDQALCDALLLLRGVVQVLSPVRIPLFPARVDPVIVLSDAFYRARGGGGRGRALCS